MIHSPGKARPKRSRAPEARCGDCVLQPDQPTARAKGSEPAAQRVLPEQEAMARLRGLPEKETNLKGGKRCPRNCRGLPARRPPETTRARCKAAASTSPERARCAQDAPA